MQQATGAAMVERTKRWTKRSEPAARARARAVGAKAASAGPSYFPVGGWTGMLCAALGFVVFGVNKNKTAHLACLEEALAGKTKKRGGKYLCFLI